MYQAAMEESLNRVAKCHEYDEYIRVKIFAGWGNDLGEDAIWPKLAFFGKICTIMQYLCV